MIEIRRGRFKIANEKQKAKKNQKRKLVQNSAATTSHHHDQKIKYQLISQLMKKTMIFLPTVNPTLRKIKVWNQSDPADLTITWTNKQSTQKKINNDHKLDIESQNKWIKTSRGRLIKSSEGLDCISLTSCRILFTAGFFRLYLSSAISPIEFHGTKIPLPKTETAKFNFDSISLWWIKLFEDRREREKGETSSVVDMRTC